MTCPACGGSLENVVDGYGTCFRCDCRWELAELDTAPAVAEVEGEEEKRPRKSQATVLAQLGIDSGADFFHTPAGECYAGVPVGAHVETLALRGKAAETWLRRLYHSDTEGKAPGGAGVADAMAVLRGRALFDGAVQEVRVRVAGYKEIIIIDIGDADWQTIHVTPDGWQVLPGSGVRFRRPRGLLSLPLPERGGSVEGLRAFLNVEHDDDFRLLATWLVASMFPGGPYPVLVLNGEQGAAKSTTARVLRSLLDPNTAAVRSEPRDERDIAIAANNGWVLSLDNVSTLRDWLSDALCRIATGGGFATRELYADAEEIIFDSQRPVCLNGITDLTTRGDLADRALVVHLPAIGEASRRTESGFWAEFEAAKPRIFGALLDVLAHCLKSLPDVHLERLPRMADFALRGAAMAPALGWTTGDFLRAYAGSRHTADESVLEASLLTDYIIKLTGWSGTAAALLERLEHLATDGERKKKAWPVTPQRVANEIRRLAPALRGQGVEVTFDRTGRRRTISISGQANDESGEVPEEAVTSVTSVTPVSETGDDVVTAGDGLMTAQASQASLLPRYENGQNDACDGNDGSMQDFSKDGHSPDVCDLCGGEVDGFAPDGKPRCEAHFARIGTA